jgi:UDP-glucose 4-epimerase
MDPLGVVAPEADAMSRWLVTGGAGFIGSHLCELLLQRGHEVYALDDLSTGSARNVAPFRNDRRFHFHVDTIMNLPVLAELVDTVDIVVHLAAAVGVKLIVDSPVRTIETNISGTEVLLRCAARKRKRLLIASTSEVYGKSTELPFVEHQDLVLGASTKGRWSYAASKLIDEFLALAYWKEQKLPTTVVRLFNTVGPRQTGQYGMVLPTFVRQALRGQPITVYGSGEQSRCFCHVNDVVHALIQLCETDRTVGEVFNVGSREEISIRDLASRVKEASLSSSSIELIPYERAYELGFEDMFRRVPSIDKIGQAVGWRPALPLAQILEDVTRFERAALDE